MLVSLPGVDMGFSDTAQASVAVLSSGAKILSTANFSQYSGDVADVLLKSAVCHAQSHVLVSV